MRAHDPAVAIEPRGLGECIDLAVLLYRSGAVAIVPFTMMVAAVPTAIVVFRAGGGYGWLWLAGTFCFASPVLGAILVSAAGQHLFGEPLTVRQALGAMRASAPTLLWWSTLARGVWTLSSGLSLGILAVPAATALGRLPEVMMLERLGSAKALARCRQLSSAGFWEACGRCAGSAGFAVACGLSLFFTIDASSQLVLQTPVFLGRLSSTAFFEDALHLLSYDPLALGVASASAWLAYPLGRLAWFFCYIDQRVKSECWDLELEMRAEALRLQHAA